MTIPSAPTTMTPRTTHPASIFVLLFLASLFAFSAAQTSTTLVSVTRTTTVRVTATDNESACANFYGACVVYGDGNAAGYTTTVYRYAPTTPANPPPPPSPTPTPVVTSTTTFLATTTASNSDACQNFNGACVVYGAGAGGGAASSTVYYAGSEGDGGNGHQGVGNSGGYIAAQGNDRGGDGQIGGTAGATALKRSTYEALVGCGLAVGVAALLV